MTVKIQIFYICLILTYKDGPRAGRVEVTSPDDSHVKGALVLHSEQSLSISHHTMVTGRLEDKKITLPFGKGLWLKCTSVETVVLCNRDFNAVRDSRPYSTCSRVGPTTDLRGGPRVVVSTRDFHARVRGSVPGLGGLKETKMFLPHPCVKVSIVGSLCDREVACSASDRQGSDFKSCVWRTVSSQSSHHPQEVLLAQFSLYVHKSGLKPDSIHFSFPTTDLDTFIFHILDFLFQSDMPVLKKEIIKPWIISTFASCSNNWL